MTPDIAERLALVFPTAALQKPGVTGVTNVADVTGYAQKPQELRQLRLLRQENDNAGKMPDEGVVADVASPIATDSGAIEEWAALATEERAAVSAAQAREAARAAGVRLGAHGEDLILEADVAPTTDVADAQTRKKPCVLGLLRAGRDGWTSKDWRAFFDERATLAEFDGGLPREQAEASAFACCVTEWLNRNPEALAAGPLPSLRGGRARPRPAAAARNRVHRPRLAAFALLVGLACREASRGDRRLRGNGDRDTRQVSKRFR